MTNGIRQYRLTGGRLSQGLLEGFLRTGEGGLSIEAEQQHRSLLLPGLDSVQEDCPWGRFSFRAVLKGDLVLTVRAFASNDPVFLRDGVPCSLDHILMSPTVLEQEKREIFASHEGITSVGASDLLLYGQTGRYLWIWVELDGLGEATLDEFRVLVPGDNFYRTFPAVYQREGDFFHRYLSIFSSLYADLQERIDHIHEYLDLYTCPAELLPTFARWLGLELDGNFLDEDHLRRLLKRMPQLIAAKGTCHAIELLVELFVSEPSYLVEHNLLDRNQHACVSGLYGDSPYDFTLLLSQRADELLHARLAFLIDQFKPLRSRAHIVFLGDQGGLDAFSYLDLNAALLQIGSGHLDDGCSQTGMIRLE